ncbi:MAG: Mu transposase domain-containing protein [Bacteroidota bacterium]
MPRHDVECCRITTATVSTRSPFRFEENSHSVPCRYANSEVAVKAFVDHVAAFRKDKQVASWPRCYDKGHKFVDFDHYLEVLVRKPGAVPFVSGFKDLCPLYHELYTAVFGMESGNKLSVRILLLAQEYPREMLDRAIEKVLRSGNASYECMVARLTRTSLPVRRARDLSHALPGKLLEFRVRPANVSQFSMLMGEGRSDV